MESGFAQRHYLLLKTHYFLFYSSLGVISPILNLTLRSHGLSNTEISFSNIILPFLVFFLSPSIGFLADKSRRFLLTFNIIFVIAVITLLTLFFLPSIQSDHIQANLHRLDSSKYVLDFCASQEMATQCSSRSECGCIYQASCRTENHRWKNFTFTMTSSDLQKELNDYQPSQCGITYRIPIDGNFSRLFQKSPSIKCEITCSIAHFCHGIRRSNQLIYIILYGIFYVIGASFLSTSNAVGASIGLTSLSDGNRFGKQRVWGTIGFGILAFVTSRIYERFHSEYVYVIIFSVIALLTLLVTSCLRISSSSNPPVDKKKDKFHLSSLMSLLKNVDVLVFLSITFVWGMCFGSLQPYSFLYLDEIAPCQSRSVIGYMSLIAAISEVIAFLIASQVIRFFGMNLSSILIFLAFAIRFSGYYFIQTPYLFLPFETTHFFNFGILYVLIVQKADALAPAGMSGTLQGVAHGITHGLGRGIGLLVSSFIYIVIDQRLLFLVFALFNLIAAFIYSIYFLFTRTKRTNPNLSLSHPLTDIDLPLNEETFPSLTKDPTNDEQIEMNSYICRH